VASLNSSFSFLLAKFRVVQLLNKAYVAILRRRTDHVAERVTPDEFRSNLQEIVRIARSHGITPVLLTAPSSFEKGHEPVFLRERWLRDLDSLIPLHQQYVSIVRNVAHELGVPLCDLAREFDALPKEEVRERLFRKDGIHPTPDGDRMIAQFLFNCLKENGLLEKIGR
jgi:lysophospholipase L1-like esterase